MREVLPEAGIKQFRIPVVPAGVWILLAALLGQVALFSVIAQNFLSASNFVEVLRFQCRARIARGRTDARDHYGRN
jgi:hypothetical protein